MRKEPREFHRLAMCVPNSIRSVAADVIRIAQSIGMSLKEIAALNEERHHGELTCERDIEVMSAQLARLEAKATELEMMISYARQNRLAETW